MTGALAAATPARRLAGLVVVTGLVVVGLAAGLVADVGRPYPGFLADLDGRVFPVEDDARAAGLAHGDRIVGVDGAPPLALLARPRAGGGPARYEVERAGRRFTVTLASRPLPWRVVRDHFAGYFAVSGLMLGAGLLVFWQNPAAEPNRRFLAYMCLWSMGNCATAESILGPSKWGAPVMGIVPTMLVVHGWVVFLTYPTTAVREAWLGRHRVVPRLYRGGIAMSAGLSVVFGTVYALDPERLAADGLYRASALLQYALAVASFPVKTVALWDTRRRAASPLVNQQTAVLLLGIGLGLGAWLLLMLTPLMHLWASPVDPQVGSVLVLLYPVAIAYATVRYRLFDATVVIRRSLVYTVVAGLITGAYALLLAAANAVLAQADLVRSPWFSAGVMFAVALAFNPLRERVRGAVDRTFFRERADAVGTLQALARSMRSLLDLAEIRGRLGTTLETALRVRQARLLVGPETEWLAETLAAAPGALSRYQLAADPRYAEGREAALGAFASLGAEVVVPLRFQDALTGVLVLGPKRSEAPYTDDDLALLETVADQAAVAVANAEAHRRVLDYTRELERSLLIRGSLAKFVPERVRTLIEASPEAPSLDKRETDVSVLFADITGYTRLTSRVAPEVLDELVQRYFGAFLDEIVHHGGDVNETAGDGLMVIFHEGAHPRAAVEAARGIHRRAAELNAELAGRADPLAMHVGINTGPALLGATKIEGRAGTRWTYTASGLTTNVAARLAAVAAGGEIVVSGATLARLDGAVDAEDLGVQALKNVEQPVRAYRVR